MRIVISTSYYNFCDHWPIEYYIDYESPEKFYLDFCEWCERNIEIHSGSGFLGLDLYPVHIQGNERYGQIQIYTLDQWWELNEIKRKDD